MARIDRVGAARWAAGGAEKKSVKSFVKSGFAAGAAGRVAGVGGVARGGVADVEAIGREQQRRAVAYSRSRGQL